jgi:predicted  nucleic acid-binding Zn-ribbon protein
MNPQLQLLVALQDLEHMIRETEDQDKAQQEKEMGFDLSGLEKLKKSHAETVEKIDPRHLSYYRRLTKRFGHAVVPVIGNLCTGCFANIPSSFTSVTHENKILHCENCGRILYWP